MKRHTVEQAVRYAETDRMQVVHHSTFLLWFETARTALLAEHGFPYHDIEKEGTLLPVVEYSCRITGPADYGDTVVIETRVASARSRSVVFSYTVKNRGIVIASGTTTHVAVDRNKRTKRLPAALLGALRACAEVASGSGNP
jgi:acyl-CoA thioester hydrolase